MNFECCLFDYELVLVAVAVAYLMYQGWIHLLETENACTTDTAFLLKCK